MDGWMEAGGWRRLLLRSSPCLAASSSSSFALKDEQEKTSSLTRSPSHAGATHIHTRSLKHHSPLEIKALNLKTGHCCIGGGNSFYGHWSIGHFVCYAINIRRWAGHRTLEAGMDGRMDGVRGRSRSPPQSASSMLCVCRRVVSVQRAKERRKELFNGLSLISALSFSHSLSH